MQYAVLQRVSVQLLYALPGLNQTDAECSHVHTFHAMLCRYTAFLVLYPIGVVSEMVLLYQGVPYVRRRDLYSIRMPNKWNFAWDYALFIQVRLIVPRLVRCW